MARPRSGECVKDEFTGLYELGISHVVSLLEVGEAYELDLADEDSHCSEVGMSFESFPIEDRGVPSSAEDLSRLVCGIYHRCVAGEGTVIHCRAGIGRTGLVAASVLLHCGYEVGDALRLISVARKVQVPDTPEQVEWLELNERAVSQCHLSHER